MAAAAIGGGAVLAAWTWLALPRAPLVVVTPTVVPPAQVLVEVSAPPAPPAPPAEAPPEAPPEETRPARTVGKTCVEDTSTIGLPLGEPTSGSWGLLGVSASGQGCTIAAWAQQTLYISWDGGQTFADFAMTGSFVVAAASGRVAIVRDGRELGVVQTGDSAITWHTITGLAERDGDHNTVTDVVASGRWSVVAAAKLVMATDDDGATWRYLTPPVNDFRLGEIDPDGRLTATAVVPLHPQTEGEMNIGGPVEVETRRFETRIIAGHWRTLPALPGTLTAATRSWSYLLDTDEFWGCGSNQKVVAVRGRRREWVAGGLRDDNYHVSIAASADVAFAGYDMHLHRIVGARSEIVAEMPDEDPRIRAIDGGGSPLAIGASGLLRWSARGGWRRLLSVP